MRAALQWLLAEPERVILVPTAALVLLGLSFDLRNAWRHPRARR